ncbi:hypothetical protein [Pseudomonas sp. MWU16-30322]|uniref:hypothetical protein n=1 Tax=Pseudomonas sp. MWU16-30322 TaxID=2878092 RepID=UPI001CFAC31E|nr:hypothetical protein [Pseudomonas sp. MWU16-30322]
MFRTWRRAADEKILRRGELLAQMRLQAQMIGVRSNVLQTVYLAEIPDLNGNLW